MVAHGTVWRRALIALATVALFTLGLAVVVYATLARERIGPTPTAQPTWPPATEHPSPAGQKPPTPWRTPTAPTGVAVVGTVREYSVGALVILLSPIEGNAEQVIVPENLRVTFGDGKLAAPRDLLPGCVVYAEGTLDALGRLIARQIVIVQPAPVALPSPSATQVAATRLPTVSPTIPALAWLGEYWSNRSLSGTPAFARIEKAIEYQWQQAAPVTGLPADDFSVRWRGHWSFEEGGYRFYALADDGVRLFVNGESVIDNWREQVATLVYHDVYLHQGQYDVQVDYFEAKDVAQVRVWWEYLGLYPDWKGEYYSNPNLAGPPALVRNDAAVDFNWSLGAPAPSLPSDGFSVRWTRRLTLEEGPYRFVTRVEGGVRLFVDTLLLLDAWDATGPQTYTSYASLDGGSHQVRLEYAAGRGSSEVHLGWDRLDSFADWKGEYYANPTLTGRPAFVRDDESIGFSWGKASPGNGLPADNFSVRWTRRLELLEGRYGVRALADDGIRVVIDGRLIVDQWHDAPLLEHSAEIWLAAGHHTVSVDYYERGDNAQVAFALDLLGTLTPTATLRATPSLQPTSTATVTHVPPTVATRTATTGASPSATATRITPSPSATMTLRPVTPVPSPTRTLTPRPSPMVVS